MSRYQTSYQESLYRKERNRLGKFAILSNLRFDPNEIYELYKPRDEVEVAFDAMQNELENERAYLRTPPIVWKGISASLSFRCICTSASWRH